MRAYFHECMSTSSLNHSLQQFIEFYRIRCSMSRGHDFIHDPVLNSRQQSNFISKGDKQLKEKCCCGCLSVSTCYAGEFDLLGRITKKVSSDHAKGMCTIFYGCIHNPFINSIGKFFTDNCNSAPFNGFVEELV